MTYRLLTVVLAVPCAAALAADPPRAVGGPEAVELVILAGDRPARVALHVEVDDRPAARLWDAAFDRLFAFFDADSNGSLSEAEAARLPSAFALRQVQWGQFNPQAGGAPPFNGLDANGDRKLTREELTAWYARAGVGGTVGVGTAPGTTSLTDALVRALDANGDGRVSEAEWKAAPAALRRLDANDDELVSPGELVAKLVYPGAAGTARLTPPGAGASASFPVLVLPADGADTRWAAEVLRRTGAGRLGLEPPVFAGLDVDKNGVLSAAELAGWRKSPADATWHVRFDTTSGRRPVVTAAGDGASAPGWARGRVRVDLRPDDGRLPEQARAARKRSLSQFAEADADRDGAVTAEEAAKLRPAPLRALVPAADRNGDGRLAEQELVAWLDLQDALARAHTLVTVLDLGTGLFEMLDADHDGALSARELRAAWERLGAAGCVTDGAFDRAKLPRHLCVVVSRGVPSTPLGRPPRSGPDWFRAMDRNGDGDVSRREFSGPAAVFEALDLDRDETLSAGEAERAGTKK